VRKDCVAPRLHALTRESASICGSRASRDILMASFADVNSRVALRLAGDQREANQCRCNISAPDRLPELQKSVNMIRLDVCLSMANIHHVEPCFRLSCASDVFDVW